MKPPVDSPPLPPVAGGASVADNGMSPMVHKLLLRGWRRALAWLGLGCIGAGNPGTSAQHCAPGCVKKHADRKRRARPHTSRNGPASSMRPKHAAGSLARRSSTADRADARQRARGNTEPTR
jgi:hypothetical protein